MVEVSNEVATCAPGESHLEVSRRGQPLPQFLVDSQVGLPLCEAISRHDWTIVRLSLFQHHQVVGSFSPHNPDTITEVPQVLALSDNNDLDALFLEVCDGPVDSFHIILSFHAQNIASVAKPQVFCIDNPATQVVLHKQLAVGVADLVSTPQVVVVAGVEVCAQGNGICRCQCAYRQPFIVSVSG